ncbi:MAG: hypothetical protein JNK15_02110, partial [Planctomycetes bacterium]|nr:hypothetical protein [Planctomycetota bacterium]
QFDQGGWPIVADDAPAPGPEPRQRPVATAPASGNKPSTAGERGGNGGVAGNRSGARGANAAPLLASGMQAGSPLLEVFQGTRPPGSWRAIGGVVVSWRVTIHGTSGETIGVREVVHTADTTFAERDRLEYTDNRVFGRVGAQVFAERSGMPSPGQIDQAAAELLLFGTQLRCPWLFGDANAFAVVQKDVEDRGGERLHKAVLERRPPVALDLAGPELDPKPRDRFELLYDPGTGMPRELVQRFASSREARRVLLEDWREWEGVQLAHRRVYVDESLRPTTVLEITRIERQRVSERDFRLH